MTRRDFLATVAGAACITTFVTRRTSAQDQEFIRAMERAQQERPATLSATARIAPQSEPGTPLVIHGRVVGIDGRTPLGGAVVFAYHTDREGLYDRAGTAPHSWRLRGWARTDPEGRFEFQTIRPGAYPSRNIAAHVHFNVFTADGQRFHGGALEFDDDPLIRPADRAQPNSSGEFGTIRRVRRTNGVEHVDFAIRINPQQRF